jgi:ATP-binding cassette subfamily B protein
MIPHPLGYSPASLPASWSSIVSAKILPTENVLGWMQVDLDAQLCFNPGILICTEGRLLSVEKDAKGELQTQIWDFKPGLKVNYFDYAGVGNLELLDSDSKLVAWRFTLKYQQDASHITELVNLLCQSLALDPQASPGQDSEGERLSQENRCPQCKALLDASGQCRSCQREAPAPAVSWSLFRLWRFAKPYQWQLLSGFLLTLAATAATLVPPYLTMPLMDDVLIPFQNGQQIDIDKVSLYLMGLFGSALLAWGLGWAKTYILALVSERIGADLRTSAYEHLLKLSLEYFGGRRTGDLMSRIGSETDRLCVFLSLHLLDFATDVLMIVMTAFILVAIDPWLAVATLVPLPFIAWLIHIVRDRLRTGFEKIDRVWSELTNVLADTIPGIRVVKAFAQEERETARFREANRHNLNMNDRINFLWSLFSPTVTMMTEVGLLVVWAFGIWQVAHHDITVGVLTAFLAYIGRFYNRLDSMSRIVSNTQKAAAGAKRIFEILDHVSSVPEPKHPKHLGAVRGEIQINQAGFRYGNRAVIKDLTLNIQPGEMIGLVGQSGSGKSTMVNLICRFYDLSEGAIQLDGVDIRDLTLAEYRSHIGLVLQEPFLFFGTIAENIAYGRPAASRQEIVNAARAANAHEFILRLPQGYDSLVGERGQGLSGGERQRISIARALLINPKILIMDEATSSVDTETEQEIQKALDNLVKGRTTIAIAHRLSTLHKADRLVVMEAGQIVEMGKHDELLQRKGAYWRLYEAQARQAEQDRTAFGSQGRETHVGDEQ